MSFQHLGERGSGRAGLLYTVFLLTFFAANLVQAATCHVTTAGDSVNNGLSWGEPMDLQTALEDVNCTEVWVQSGLYTPVVAVAGSVTDNERTISFDIKPNVAMYGGFDGVETSLGERDPATNITILSGDIDDNDENTDGNNVNETSDDIQGSNSYHVVYMDGTTGTNITASTVFDGFIITGGQAEGSGRQGRGGAWHCNGSGSGNECSPTLNNVSFTGNNATGNGGAMFNDGSTLGVSSPTLSNITFSGNAGRVGGAMYNNGSQGISSPTLNNATFSGNSVEFYGGAMFNAASNGVSSPALSNVTFSGNDSNNSGGAMYNSGGAGNSSPTLSNVTFNKNSAYHGAAIFNSANSGISRPVLSNVILWGNIAKPGGTGPEIKNFPLNGGIAEPTIDHSVIQGSGASDNWDSELGIDAGDNLDADPLLGPLGNNGGQTMTLLPDAGSSAIDAGNASTCSDATTVNNLDQRGIARPWGAACDIGAVEYVEDDVFIDGFE